MFDAISRRVLDVNLLLSDLAIAKRVAMLLLKT